MDTNSKQEENLPLSEGTYINLRTQIQTLKQELETVKTKLSMVEDRNKELNELVTYLKANSDDNVSSIALQNIIIMYHTKL